MIYEHINICVPIAYQSQLWKKTINKPIIITASYSATKLYGVITVEVYELHVKMQMHQHITWVPQIYEYINNKCKEHFTHPERLLQHLNLPDETKY